MVTQRNLNGTASGMDLKDTNEKNEKGENNGNFENIENFSRRRMGKIGTNKERTLAILT